MRNLFPLQRFEVTGSSMAPTLTEGQRVVVYSWGTPKVGDTIVCKKGGLTLVKRISKKEADRYFVRGDNYSASTDSLDFGAVTKNEVVGKVILKY